MISYKRLWKMLENKHMTRTELGLACEISTATIAKMGKQQEVHMKVIDRICKEMHCKIEDIIEYVPDKK